MADQPAPGRKRMGRPPKPPGERVEKTGVALRPGDLEVLQRLSVERFIIAGGGDLAELWRSVFERGERPTVSSAVRHLIDAERDRRAEKAARRWRKAHPRKAAPSAGELLAPDFVFGTPGGPPTVGEMLARVEPHVIVDGTLRRAQDYELAPAKGGGLKPRKRKS